MSAFPARGSQRICNFTCGIRLARHRRLDFDFRVRI
jgi:hypothetical protein